MQHPPLIAVVDDDASVRTGMQRLLRAHEFAVDVYESATLFLAALSTRIPNCVLLDLHMPEMDGFYVLEALRTRPGVLPVIVITADCNPAVIGRATAAGALQCLTKPVDETILIDAIRDAVGRGPLLSEPRNT